MAYNQSLSIIFPVYNERDNLEYLIPQFSNLCKSLLIEYEIIVVDDLSDDGTSELLKELRNNNFNSKHIIRKNDRSLPKSIMTGIESSKFESVMWLDADGSMDIFSAEVLIKEYLKNPNNYYVGSRFVSGGGYKGQDPNEKNFIKFIKNIKNSEDSLIAVYLSLLFNKALKKLINIEINDLTSGFIIGNRKNIDSSVFLKSNYGEYFVYLVNDLISKKQNIVEVGYICKPRKFGNSKTSNNIMTLIRLGLPYVKAAILCKKNHNKKKKF